LANPLPITANASCTTNATAPVASILHSAFGIIKASMVTVHAYTATQKLVDAPDPKDLRRGRAAAINMSPSTTGAAEAVVQAIPDMEGKFEAVSVRVPIPAGSLSVTSAHVSKKTTEEEVNALFERAAGEERWNKSLKVTHDALVSSDIVGEPYGSIVDLSLTKVLDGDFITVYAWYDNEAGYTATLVEHVRRVAASL
jgi:glyceraldehyde 3-phosphate dehydrogenase